MTRHIICTIGTSLLTNRDDRPWSGWTHKPATPLPDPTQVDAWLRGADPSRISAETNTLRALELGDGDALALLYSDTPEGEYCAERLRGYYEGVAREVDSERIGALGYSAARFEGGLKALVDSTLRRVHASEKRGLRPVLAATGGFKAELAFLNLLGALLGLEVVYLHELHRELVRLPSLPLTWDAALVARHSAFFSWIDAEPRRSDEVESRLHSAPELRTLVADTADGHTYLTAAGDLLFKVAKERLQDRPRAIWPDADARPPSSKNQVSEVGHHRPAGWERFVLRVCAVDCVSVVRYDAAARGGPRCKVIDDAAGVVGLRYGADPSALPLRVETMARGAAQTELVANYLACLH